MEEYLQFYNLKLRFISDTPDGHLKFSIVWEAGNTIFTSPLKNLIKNTIEFDEKVTLPTEIGKIKLQIIQSSVALSSTLQKNEANMKLQA